MHPSHTNPNEPSLMDKAKHAVGMDKHNTPTTATGYNTSHQTHGTAVAGEKPSMMDKVKGAVGMGKKHGSGSSSSSDSGGDNKLHHHEGHHGHATATGIAYGTTGTHQGYTNPVTQHATYGNTGTAHTGTGYGGTDTVAQTPAQQAATHKPTMIEKVKGTTADMIDKAKGKKHA